MEEGGETAFPVADNATFSTEVQCKTSLLSYKLEKKSVLYLHQCLEQIVQILTFVNYIPRQGSHRSGICQGK